METSSGCGKSGKGVTFAKAAGAPEFDVSGDIVNSGKVPFPRQNFGSVVFAGELSRLVFETMMDHTAAMTSASVLVLNQ